MSDITIFHNRARSTACKVPAMIRHGGAGPRVVHCLETLPGRARSIELLAGLGIAVRERLRRKRTPCDALKLDDPTWTDDRLLGFITAHPILMNRPPGCDLAVQLLEDRVVFTLATRKVATRQAERSGERQQSAEERSRPVNQRSI
jgi:arsenate reductase-like glutaredoxin family protein